MKLLIISDTHGCTSVIDGLIRAESPDVLFHLGDMQTDLKMSFLKKDIPVYSVPGNCDDPYRTDGAEICVDLAGHRIFALHGHTRNMRLDPQRGIYAALEKNADVLLYGHTHIPLWDNFSGLTVVNPGTARFRSVQKATYAVMTLVPGETPNGRILPVEPRHMFEER
ncbi:MAG: YfcE family phosphodiesterase [Clostridia bacterium]|nr:YfcE family phosphodiesterase [Clostridia bacterium]